METKRLSERVLRLALYKSPHGFTTYARTDHYAPRPCPDGSLIYGEIVISTEDFKNGN